MKVKDVGIGQTYWLIEKSKATKRFPSITTKRRVIVEGKITLQGSPSTFSVIWNAHRWKKEDGQSFATIFNTEKVVETYIASKIVKAGELQEIS